ncbi:MAG: hypothetical protein IJU70_06935 [Lentisphaeria bacterium]|nr:hypothetical protein [Lentisphaeria bacterium]
MNEAKMTGVLTEIEWEIESLNNELTSCRAMVAGRAGEIAEITRSEGADRKYLIEEMTGLAAALQRDMVRMTEIAARRDALANVLAKLGRAE